MTTNHSASNRPSLDPVELQPRTLAWDNVRGRLRNLSLKDRFDVEFNYSRPSFEFSTPLAWFEWVIRKMLGRLETPAWFQIDAISENSSSPQGKIRVRFSHGNRLSGDQIHCKKCGHSQPRRDAYCNHCGSLLKSWPAD